MKKFGVIVLHYKTIEKTKQCIDSLLRLDNNEEAVIVIVDNGSNDGTESLLKQKYVHNDSIHVLHNENNLGFSRGNNVGYSFLKEKFPTITFIVVINNDIIIRQVDFYKKTMLYYNKYRFAVAGPDIYTPGEKKHYNPLPNMETNPEKVLARIDEEKKKAISSFGAFFIDLLRKYFGRVCRSLFGEFFMNKDGMNYSECKALHGSALIFSIDYITKYRKAFDPEPFLFREEDILFAKCQADNMKMVYIPELVVIHEHSSSRKYVNGRSYQRFKYTQKEYAKADEIYYEYLNSLPVVTRKKEVAYNNQR